MAKYAVGYVLALLLLAVVGLSVWAGGGLVRLPWQNFGGGFVDVGRPMPAPFPLQPEVFPDHPEMVVTDAGGTTRLSPMSFCWTTPNSSMCSESDWARGSEPLFVATDEQPVTFDFQMFWNVDIVASHTEIDCGQAWSLTDTWDMQVDLDVPGEYLVEVTTSNAQGHAQWVLRIDSQVEGDGGC